MRAMHRLSPLGGSPAGAVRATSIILHWRFNYVACLFEPQSGAGDGSGATGDGGLALSSFKGGTGSGVGGVGPAGDAGGGSGDGVGFRHTVYTLVDALHPQSLLPVVQAFNLPAEFFLGLDVVSSLFPASEVFYVDGKRIMGFR